MIQMSDPLENFNSWAGRDMRTRERKLEDENKRLRGWATELRYELRCLANESPVVTIETWNVLDKTAALDEEE